MNYHNTDICACDNAQCAMHNKCLRWQLYENMDKYQVIAHFEPISEIDCMKLIETRQDESKG